MNVTALALFAAIAVAATTVRVATHHSFAAEFDANRPLTVSGTVTKLEWTNPHARLYVDEIDKDGKVLSWDFELGPPNGLMRNGWNRNSLKAGHKVTVTGFHSKTNPRVANARTVTLADGRRVLAGSSFDTGPAQ